MRHSRALFTTGFLKHVLGLKDCWRIRKRWSSIAYAVAHVADLPNYTDSIDAKTKPPYALIEGATIPERSVIEYEHGASKATTTKRPLVPCPGI